jgi:carbon-monoxide dehydrogenase medium subunit
MRRRTAIDAGPPINPMAIEDFFTGRGEAPFAVRPDEMVTEIQVPLHPKGFGSSFQKLTYRSAIDYGLVSSAVALGLEGGKVSWARIAVGGAGASPLILKEAAGLLVGRRPGDGDAVEATSETVRKHASAFMVDNLGATVDYRRKMAGVMTRRAVLDALERATSVSTA